MRTVSLPTLKGIGSTPERAIDEEVIFVGHSVGGSVLLSYLAVARTRSLSGRSPANSCGQPGVRKAPARQRRELRASLSSPGAVLGQGPVLQQPGFVLAPLLWGK
jgi:alpha-beta hydrolase superfamily lysophospholipase